MLTAQKGVKNIQISQSYLSQLCMDKTMYKIFKYYVNAFALKFHSKSQWKTKYNCKIFCNKIYHKAIYITCSIIFIQ